MKYRMRSLYNTVFNATEVRGMVWQLIYTLVFRCVDYDRLLSAKYLTRKVKTQYVHFRSHALYFALEKS